VNHTPVELGYDESHLLLRSDVVGRVAFHPPVGLRIVPVNYTVLDDSIIWRTSPHTELGTYGADREAVFEADHLDQRARQGWSVIASGRIEVIDDYDLVVVIRAIQDPRPWAAGMRHLYMRLRIDNLTGRRIGPSSEWLWLTRAPLPGRHSTRP
jgi:nitroimidazol reductase NimA-like FMN-containing flavoprotein (pyridoxamine 5'-phosphate oxidase superfamily)